jgi:uncharacterized membrane protein (DUF106 family)
MEETTEVQSGSMYQHAAKFGAILGGISIVLTVLAYAFDPGFMATFKFMGINLVIFIGFIIYAGISYRNSIGGFMPYGKAFLYCLTVMLTAGVVGTVFNVLLYHVIDTNLPETMTDTIIANTEEFMTKFNTPQDAMDKALAQMRIDLPEQFTVSGLLMGFVKKGIITYAIISLIFALFVRKNQPVEA